jgi:hypothetical protein
MNNIEPKYVTFEQAKWLKEIGFDENCKNVVENNEFFIHNGFDTKNSEIIPSACTIPEQWQVVEWLRVNHGIWVESLHRGDMGDFIFKVVELNENNWKKHPHYIHNEGFNSPQEAYSAAFDYIKENNLI